MPPISAWLELDGSPTNQVMRFHVIAPTRPASTMSSVIASWSTIPFAIVAATAIETKAPAKLSTAALATARRGRSARVETLVAIEFAVSWKPFVKSKKSATATTAQSMSSSRVLHGGRALGVLDDDVRDRVRGRLAAVERAARAGRRRPSSGSPSAGRSGRRGRATASAVAEDAVALVLEPLELDERLLDAREALQVVAGDRELLGRRRRSGPSAGRRASSAARSRRGRAGRMPPRARRRRRRSRSRACRCRRGRTASGTACSGAG